MASKQCLIGRTKGCDCSTVLGRKEEGHPCSCRRHCVALLAQTLNNRSSARLAESLGIARDREAPGGGVGLPLAVEHKIAKFAITKHAEGAADEMRAMLEIVPGVVEASGIDVAEDKRGKVVDADPVQQVVIAVLKLQRTR